MKRRSTDRHQFLFLQFVLLLFNTIQASLEGDSLFAFKQALVDPNGFLETWDSSLINPCTWLYVTCDESELVTRVDLAHAGLSGRLVPEIANLKNLKHLELFNNNLSSSIPAQLGKLKQLISFDLQHNSVSGFIPPTLAQMSSLVFLRLNNNRLSGQIPAQLTSLSSLQVLDLSYNSLSGSVPRVGSFRKFSPKSFEGNPRLCGQAVNKSCT